MNRRNWEVFTARNSRMSRTPTLTIQKQGALSINAVAFEAMGSPEFVELLYDPGNRLIGLRPVAEEESHTYAVRRQGNSASYRIAAKAFIDYVRLSLDETRRYDVEVDDGVLVVDLKQTPHIRGQKTANQPNVAKLVPNGTNEQREYEPVK